MANMKLVLFFVGLLVVLCVAGDAKEGSTCDNVACERGYKCVETEVQCFVAPCLPVPECVPIACTREYRPVCGADGNTYNNNCLLEVAGVKLDHSGACQ